MDENIRHTLPKKERLCGKTSISRLLAKGRHGNVPGIRYCFIFNCDSTQANRILVSVPKKLFKRAVKRNLLKRRLRESWRKQKHALSEGIGCDILFTYSSKEILSYGEIYEAIGQVIEKINRHNVQKSLVQDDVKAEE